uniref:Uncharacterized protein n=2 Tax=Clastoptera arizonana TaxID=38151 RepID=A0A1B6C377_9HEMI
MNIIQFGHYLPKFKMMKILLIFSVFSVVVTLNYRILRDIHQVRREVKMITKEANATLAILDVTPEQKYAAYRNITLGERMLFQYIYDVFPDLDCEDPVVRDEVKKGIDEIDELEKYRNEPVEFRLQKMSELMRKIKLLRYKLHIEAIVNFYYEKFDIELYPTGYVSYGYSSE